jgi:hypothetical protein
MNPKPQVIIFQTQQNLETSLFVISFYKKKFLESMSMKTKKYLTNNANNRMGTVQICIFAFLVTYLFFILLLTLNRNVFSLFFNKTHTHRNTDLTLLLSSCLSKTFLVITDHNPACHFWTIK